ncbi:hypothetical protein R0J90_19830, partial [Micrococcus sp. SIMBA_144]
VGGNVRAIGSTPTYSTFPAHVSARLPPAGPHRVAPEVSAMIRAAHNPASAKALLAGTVMMAAHDRGLPALGMHTTPSPAVLEA